MSVNFSYWSWIQAKINYENKNTERNTHRQQQVVELLSLFTETHCIFFPSSSWFAIYMSHVSLLKLLTWVSFTVYRSSRVFFSSLVRTWCSGTSTCSLILTNNSASWIILKKNTYVKPKNVRRKWAKVINCHLNSPEKLPSGTWKKSRWYMSEQKGSDSAGRPRLPSSHSQSSYGLCSSSSSSHQPSVPRGRTHKSKCRHSGQVITVLLLVSTQTETIALTKNGTPKKKT